MAKFRAIGVDTSGIGLHSLRIGGASAALSSGVPDHVIKNHGRWKSDSAKELYCRENLPGGTPLYKVYRYVPPQREWFLSRFGLKTGIDFDNYGLKSGRVFGAGNIYESLQTYFSSQYVTGTTQ